MGGGRGLVNFHKLLLKFKCYFSVSAAHISPVLLITKATNKQIQLGGFINVMFPFTPLTHLILFMPRLTGALCTRSVENYCYKEPSEEIPKTLHCVPS